MYFIMSTMGKNRVIPIFFIILLISVFISSFIFFHKKNTLDLAARNIETFSKQQAYFLSRDIERMFNSIDLFVKYLEDENKSFEQSIGSGLCASTLNTYDFESLCFADEDGYVMNHLGKRQGNVKDLKFFDNIVNGESKVMDVIYGSFNSSVPKVIIAMPLHQNGKFKGVIFGNKNLDKIQLQFFKYSGDVDSIIVDSNSVIVASNRDYAIGAKFEDNSSENIIVRNNLDFNGWQLITVMSKSAAIERYKGEK